MLEEKKVYLCSQTISTNESLFSTYWGVHPTDGQSIPFARPLEHVFPSVVEGIGETRNSVAAYCGDYLYFYRCNHDHSDEVEHLQSASADIHDGIGDARYLAIRVLFDDNVPYIGRESRQQHCVGDRYDAHHGTD